MALASRLQVSWQDASERGRQEEQTRTHRDLLEVRQLTYTAAGEDPKLVAASALGCPDTPGPSQQGWLCPDRGGVGGPLFLGLSTGGSF